MTTISDKYTAYRLTKIGSFENIKPIQESIRELEKNEILVKIRAVTLNYRDIVISGGTYVITVKEGVIPTSDGAGDVVKVGSDVKNFKAGDRVISVFLPAGAKGQGKYGADEDGVLSEYRIFTSDAIVKIPNDSHLTYEEASSIVCAGTTAWNCLNAGRRPLKRGQTVLFLGTGGVSIIGVILAKAAGATTIITSSSDEKINYVKETYGADHGINYRTHPDWEKEVLALTNGEGVDIVVENGGIGTVIKSIASVKHYGEINLVGFLAPPPDQVPDLIIPLMLKCASLRGIGVGSYEDTEDLVRFVHEHKVRLPIEDTFGFTEEQVHAAYKKLESQTAVGKIAIKID